MQLLYQSDSFVVVRIDVPAGSTGPLGRGGFEIVDKFARKGIFIEGKLAEDFIAGVQELAGQGPDEEAMDAFIGGYTQLAQQPVVLH
jgi:Protein of unknown function (DUF3567)